MKKTSPVIMICNIVSIVLILALLAMQFLPFWPAPAGEEGFVSLAKSVWFTNPKSGIPVMMGHVAILFMGIVCLYFCIAKMKSPMTFIPLTVTSVWALKSYLTTPGASEGFLWIVHVIMTALLLLPAAVLLVFWLIRVAEWFFKKEQKA